MRPEDARPPGLLLLQERPGLGGKQAIGIYGAVADAKTPGLWRIKLWDEQPNDVKVRSETIRCTLRRRCGLLAMDPTFTSAS